jgi:RNA polymerase sigma-70 factor (ECF subfamily)
VVFGREGDTSTVEGAAMNHADRPTASSDARFDEAWRHHHDRLVARAARMLADRGSAEDVVQEAFRRLHDVPIDEINDIGAWLAVVVRRLCLNQLRTAYVRREVTGAETSLVSRVDPLDRVTLDDEVKAALAVVLDTLTPAERTAFVLHDVFGFPFDAVAVIVGRTPAAVRQLASRARRSIREDVRPDAPVDTAPAQHALVVERFIAACAGGDIAELVSVLDPDVDGHAELIGFGTIADESGRPAVAQRLVGLFGPGTDSLLVPVTVEGEAGVVVYAHGRLAALVRLEHENDTIRRMRAFVLPPRA